MPRNTRFDVYLMNTFISYVKNVVFRSAITKHFDYKNISGYVRPINVTKSAQTTIISSEKNYNNAPDTPENSNTIRQNGHNREQ
jgi:hypothetical protein